VAALDPAFLPEPGAPRLGVTMAGV
jgi:hypothetical protein